MTKASRLFMLLFPVGILLTFSLTILSSIDSSFLQQQAISIAIAAIVFLFFSYFDYHVYTVSAWIWYALSVASLLSIVIFGTFSRGAVRWIDLGIIRFQPSEFVKPLLVIFFAVFIAQSNHRLSAYIKLILAALLPLALIFKQPDLGTTIIVMAVMGSQLLASKFPKKFIVMTILPIIVSAPIIWTFLLPYQKDRVHSFIAPSSDPLGTGYNAIQAVISVGSGKIFGRGLGQGTQSQLKFLPESQTDFIFAAISEEFGFLGSATIIACYIWILSFILNTASKAKDETSQLLCIGTFAVIVIQAFVNIGMNMGILPITGITLPLISLGGSSLISLAMMLGFIANVSNQHYPNRPVIEIK